MNKLTLIFIALLFTGCATIRPDTYNIEPEINTEMKIGIGDNFFLYEHYTNINDPLLGGDLSFGKERFDLTVMELNNEKIAFQYAEYTHSNGSWLIKQGFNKTFTYSPKETIRFRGYEFEPIGVSSGRLTYKRVK